MRVRVRVRLRVGVWVTVRMRVRVRVRDRDRVRDRVRVRDRLESVWFSAARMSTSSPSMSAIECLLSSLTDRLRIAPAVAACTSPAQG